MIVNLMERKVGYKALETRLKHIWVKKCLIRIIDMSNDYYFMAFLHDDDDKNPALVDGP